MSAQSIPARRAILGGGGGDDCPFWLEGGIYLGAGEGGDLLGGSGGG